MPFHHITTEHAAELITAFLNVDALGTIGVDNSIGGLIDLDMVEEEIEGWSFWFCWNTRNSVYPKFFVAYEPNVYGEDPAQVSVESEYLYKPFNSYVFKFPSNIDKTYENVLNFIINPVKEWDGDKSPDPQISNALVVEYSDAFLDTFPGNGRNPYNDYAFSFFINDEVSEFVQQGSFVRYYFGYDAESESNSIRLILCSVDNDGSNQTGNNYYMMQRSWPPNA